MSDLTAFAGALAAGRIEVVDLTQTLSPDFPTIVMPPELGQCAPFRMETISRYDDNNDGVVTIESQLVRWAQDQAKSLSGFNESHMGMLQSAEVEAKLWPILEAAR